MNKKFYPVVLSVWLCIIPAFAEETLPGSVVKALTAYEAQLKQADEDVAKRKQAAKNVLLKSLDEAQREEVVKGNAEMAAAIKAKRDEVAAASATQPSDLTADVKAAKPDIGKIYRWLPIDAKRGITEAQALGPLPKGVADADVFDFLEKGDYKAKFSGLTLDPVKIDPDKTFHSPSSPEIVMYYVFFLKAKTDTDVTLVGSTRLHNGNYAPNAVDVYVDSAKLAADGKFRLTTAGHVVVVKQTHFKGEESWIKFSIVGSDVMQGIPRSTR